MRNISLFIVSVLLMSLCSCKGAGEDILVENDGDNAKVTVTGRSRYLMLPIQESSWEVRVRAEEAAADVRRQHCLHIFFQNWKRVSGSESYLYRPAH